MIAVDTNILVYAHRADLIWHDKARPKLADLASGRQVWTIAWPCVHEFLAVVSNPKTFTLATPVDKALYQIALWAMSPYFRYLSETDDHFQTLKDVCSKANVKGGQVHDARIAAICIENGVSELWTVDRDFSRFPQLRTRNPLISE